MILDMNFIHPNQAVARERQEAHQMITVLTAIMVIIQMITTDWVGLATQKERTEDMHMRIIYEVVFHACCSPEVFIHPSISVHVQDFCNFFGDDNGYRQAAANIFANGYSPKEYEVVFLLVCSKAPSFDVFDLPPSRHHPRPLRNVEEASLKVPFESHVLLKKFGCKLCTIVQMMIILL